MIKIDNKIYVTVKEGNVGILRFPKYNIEANSYIGVNGLTKEKKEGDGKTPIGEFTLGIILGTHSKKEMINIINYKQITEYMYWVDDSKSKYYNQLVNILEVEKDWNSAEHLIEYPVEYEFLVEIKTNINNIAEKGSAIFLHCENNKPTSGCVSVNRKIMKKIIENIDKDTKIKIYENRGNKI